MMEFPGFPSNDFDWHFEEVGAALAGLVIRDRSGFPRPGVLPSNVTLLTRGSGWTVQVAPHVAVRGKGRMVLVGGATEPVTVDVVSAPNANSRIDVVYTRPADVGASEDIAAVGVAIGTPAAVPSKPSIPEGAVELGTVRSAAGNTGISQATLTNTFQFTASAGGTLIVRAVADLNTADLPDGYRAFVIATGREYLRRGGKWLREPIVWATTGSVPGTNNKEGTARVNFPASLFPSAPAVTVTPQTTVPGSANVTIGASGISASGCTVYLGRLSNQTTPFSLVAVLA